MIYYEDAEPGGLLISPAETIDREEMLAFARHWDPLPIHVDEALATQTVGGLTAPGLYVLAVKLRLVHRSTKLAVVTSFGYDEVRFHKPLRPNDTVFLEQRWTERRPSKSKPLCGILTVQYRLIRQDGEVILTHLDNLLIQRRTHCAGTLASATSLP